MLGQDIFGCYHRSRLDAELNVASRVHRNMELSQAQSQLRYDMGLPTQTPKPTNCTNCGAPRRGCGCDYCGA